MVALTVIERIEAAFLAIAEQIDGVANVLDHEPGPDLPRLPCITMLFVSPQQEDVETGPGTANRWTWRITLYVNLDDYYRAQRDLKQLLPDLMATVRRNTDLTGTCEWASLDDEGGEPVFAHDDRIVFKTLRLTARTTET